MTRKRNQPISSSDDEDEEDLGEIDMPLVEESEDSYNPGSNSEESSESDEDNDRMESSMEAGRGRSRARKQTKPVRRRSRSISRSRSLYFKKPRLILPQQPSQGPSSKVPRRLEVPQNSPSSLVSQRPGHDNPKPRKKKMGNKCPLCGCSFKHLKQHLRGRKHKLSRQACRELMQQQLPFRTQDGRYRRRCPVPGCGKVVVRLKQHLDGLGHSGLTKEDKRKFRRQALVYVPIKEDNLTPAGKGGAHTDSITPTDIHDRRSRSITPSRPPPPSSSNVQSVARNLNKSKDDGKGENLQTFEGMNAPRNRLCAEDMGSRKKSYASIVSRFWLYIQTIAGGNMNKRFSDQIANEVQAFFDFTGGESIGLLNSENFDNFIGHLIQSFKAATVLFYIRALLKFISYLYAKEMITDSRHKKLLCSLDGYRQSFQKEAKEQRTQESVNIEQNRLPAGAPIAYMNSDYVQETRNLLLRPMPDAQHFVRFRNYLLTAITFLNGHRPKVLTSMTVGQVRAATVSQVDGEEPESERTYMSFLVPNHKTSKSHGAAIVSVPMRLYREMMAFYRLSQEIYGQRSTDEPFFFNIDGSDIDSSSRINRMMNDSYEQSGVRASFPQRFCATQARKLLTTATRDADPSSSALVAGQLMHTLAMNDAVYRLQRRRQESSLAVHTMARAIQLAHQRDQERPVQATEYLTASDPQVQTSTGEQPNQVTSMALEGSGEVDRASDLSGPVQETEQQPNGSVQSYSLLAKAGEVDKVDVRSEAILPTEQNHELLWSKLIDQVTEIQTGEIPETNQQAHNQVTVMAPEGSVQCCSFEEELPEGDRMSEGSEPMPDSDIERVGEWVQQASNLIVEFPDIPVSTDSAMRSIAEFLVTADYENIHEEAQYWVKGVGLTQFRETTSFTLIADSLRDQINARFDIDLFAILEGEAPLLAAGDPDLGTTMTILAASRLGIIFGSSISPGDRPYQARKVGTVSATKLVITTPSDTSDSSDVSTVPPDNSTAAARTGPLKQKVNLQEVASFLRLLYGKEINESVKSGKKIRYHVIREHLGKVKDRFPHMTEIQIRDKLWNMALSDKKGPKSPAPITQSKRKKNVRFPKTLDAVLTRLFSKEIEESVISGAKISMADIRRKIDEVHAFMPDLSPQQLRDKLWNMAKKERVRRGL